MIIAVAITMAVGHALADGPLQANWIGRNKRTAGWRGAAAMTTHALAHGVFVWLATGMFALGLAEAGAHALIDWLKPRLRFGTLTDQLLHAACKAVWLVIFWMNT